MELFIEVVLGAPAKGGAPCLDSLEDPLRMARRLEGLGMTPVRQEEGELVYKMPVMARSMAAELRRLWKNLAAKA